jgi:hypothetical protein
VTDIAERQRSAAEMPPFSRSPAARGGRVLIGR